MMNAASSFSPKRGLTAHPTDPKTSFRLFNATHREDIFRTAQVAATIAGFRNAFGSAPLLANLPPGTVAGLHPAFGGHPATKGITLPPSLLSIVDSKSRIAPSSKDPPPSSPIRRTLYGLSTPASHPSEPRTLRAEFSLEGSGGDEFPERPPESIASDREHRHTLATAHHHVIRVHADRTLAEYGSHFPKLTALLCPADPTSAGDACYHFPIEIVI